MRVLRVCHASRDPQHRVRDRALSAAGIELTLVVPEAWPEHGAERTLSPEPFPIVEVAVRRAGNVNAHTYAHPRRLQRVISEVAPDLIDIHEEPFSAVARQWLRAAGERVPVVMFAAQNIDKRYPPPYCFYERSALERAACLYPCSRQAASVVRGKGFAGHVRVLPLGYDSSVFRPGEQTLSAEEVTLVLAGRLVREKGVGDAVRVLQRANAIRPTRLILVGDGPFAPGAGTLAASLGVADRLTFSPWLNADELGTLYRKAHLVLVPSVATYTWAEQFGRVVVEAQASGAVVAGYASGAIAETAGEAGLIVEPGDVERLAERVTDIVSDQTEYASRRSIGLQAVAPLAWPAVARRQLELYEAALAGEPSAPRLPASPRARRAGARAEFGPSAEGLAGSRPFALPYLRGGGALAAAAAAIIDSAAELRARLGLGG